MFISAPFIHTFTFLAGLITVILTLFSALSTFVLPRAARSQLSRIVFGLEAKYFGKIKFVFLDVDDPNTFDFQRTLGFRSQPEVYLLDVNGNLMKKWVGYTSKQDFETEFSKYVQ